MERVEATFIKHFANSNRSKGMNILRLKPRKQRHTTTFYTGVFAGCTFALIVALSLIIRARNILGHEGTDQYMETMFPLYSLFGFIVLHAVMYADNVYFWRRYQINYAFIFGFKQGTELGYREVLLVSFGLAVMALGSVLSNLDMEMDPKTKDYKTFAELIPLLLVVLVFIILFLPLTIMYRSSRFFFLTCLLHSILSPLYKPNQPSLSKMDACGKRMYINSGYSYNNAAAATTTIRQLSCFSSINRKFQLHHRSSFRRITHSKSFVVMSIDGHGAETTSSQLKTTPSYVAGESKPIIEEVTKSYPNADEHVPENTSDLVPKRTAKIHDFCIGIPYGGLVLSGGLLGFISSRNPTTLLFGGALLAFSTFSMKIWRQGKSSLPFIFGQTAIAAVLLWKNFQTYSLTKKLFPNAFYAAISAAMLFFYSYVVISGGNPPPKKMKVSATH